MVVLMLMVVSATALVVLVAEALLLIAAVAIDVDVDLSVVVVDFAHSVSVLMLVLVLVTVAFIPMLMVVMVMAVAFVLVQLVEQTAVVHRMVHNVAELVLVDIEDRGHEGEVDLVLGSELSVLLHAVVHVCKVECDPASVIQCDCGLDVSQENSCLGLHPFSYGQHRIAKPCLGVRVPATDPSGDSGRNSSGLFQRCLLSAHFIIS
jgi:hypothetical protein